MTWIGAWTKLTCLKKGLCAEIWVWTKCSIMNIVALEANYKVLTRWNLVPARIVKIVLKYTTNCFRGYNEQGTHLHIRNHICKKANSEIWMSMKSSTMNIVTLETNNKVLTRWYLVPERIAKIVPNYPLTALWAVMNRGLDMCGLFHSELKFAWIFIFK